MTTKNGFWNHAGASAVRSLGIVAIGATLLLTAARTPAEAGYVIKHIAGAAHTGFAGDGGPALAALLDNPDALTLAPDGTLYIADTGNNRVRRIDAAGTIATVAGIGRNESDGDSGPATAAGLVHPRDVAVDRLGNIFIVEGTPSRVRRVEASTGLISTLLGPGLADYALANDSTGTVFVTLSPVSRVYGLAYLMAISTPDWPLTIEPINVANNYPTDLTTADGRVLIIVGQYERQIIRPDGQIFWRYDPEEYSLYNIIGLALNAKGALYVTASSFYSGQNRFVLRARRQHFASIAGGGSGPLVDGAAADTVALDAGAIAADDDRIYVVHRPGQIVALEPGPRNAGRIVGRAKMFPGSLPGVFNEGTTSIYAHGDNGVFRFTRPNSRGTFRFDDLPPGNYTVYARFDEEGFSCDASDCGWSGAPNDCPQTLNDATVEIGEDKPRQIVELYLLWSRPCV